MRDRGLERRGEAGAEPAVSLYNAGFAAAGIKANDTFTILNLVSAGIGVSLVPRAARAMHIAGVKFAPVHDKYADWDIGMAWNKKLESEIIRKFAQIVFPVHTHL